MVIREEVISNEKVRSTMSKPVKTWRQRGIDIAAWESRNGGMTFTFRKTYKDKATGTYKESKYFYKDDLDALALLLTQVLTWDSTQAVGEPPVFADGDDIPF